MNIEELVEKIKRFEKLSNQRKFTLVEFREMERYLKVIRPNWNGCEHCPAQIHFGQTILKTELNNLRQELSIMTTDSPLEPTTFNEEQITDEPEIEVPVGDIIVTSECQKCKKKKENPHTIPKIKS